MLHYGDPAAWRDRPVSNLPGAYAVAANVLMESMVRSAADGRGTAGRLLPPYLYLWRHHIELQLKSILELLEENLPAWKTATGQDILPDCFSGALRSHSLKRLWEQVRPLAGTVLAREQHLWTPRSMPLTDASGLLSELDAIDPRGDGARYERHVNGDLTLLDVSRVDLEHAERNMQGIAEFLWWTRSEIGAVIGVLASEAQDQEYRLAELEAAQDDEGALWAAGQAGSVPAATRKSREAALTSVEHMLGLTRQALDEFESVSRRAYGERSASRDCEATSTTRTSSSSTSARTAARRPGAGPRPTSS
jgi:hypothetical protein